MALTDVGPQDQPTTMPPPPPQAPAPPYYIAAPGAPSQPPPQLDLGPPAPAAPVQPVVVDRVAALQRLYDEINAAKRLVAPIERMAQYGATAGDVNVTDYGYDPGNPQTWADAQQQAIARAKQLDAAGVQNVQVRYPGDQASLTHTLTNAATNVLGSVGNALTTEIPGMNKVADVAGQVGSAIGNAMPQTAIPNQLAEHLTGVNPVGTIASSLIPTQVWQAALTLLPASKARSIPELLSAITLGDTDALTALRNAGAKLGESSAVESGIRALASETGAAKIPGQQSAEELARIESLKAMQSNIRKQLSILTIGDRARLSGGGVKDVMSVAERYAADSPQRTALLSAIEPKIADLPPVKQKFIRESLSVLPQKGAREAATEAQRASQAGRGLQAFEKTAGTPFEKATASIRAFAGKQAQRFKPIGPNFTDGETTQLADMVVQAAKSGRIGRVFDQNNALDALSLLMTGSRLPPNIESKPLNLAPHEIKLLGRVFGPEFEAAIPRTAAHMSNLDKILDVVNLPRALVTAVDFSAAARQGILLAARNPVEWGKSISPMLTAMGSDEGLNKVGQNIIANPKYEDALTHGLDITDVGGGAAAEEAYVSHLAMKLPWVRGSERGYVAFLDNLRMLTYEKNANRLEAYAEKKGWDVARTDLVKEQVAKFLNHATGRGSLAGAEKFTPALNAIFFAPRYFVSRPQSVWDMVRPGADKFTRQVAFENLGAFVGTGMAMLEAVRLSGVGDVELDPRSADFGRVKIGDSRFDFWGGYQPIARYLAQIATGHTKNTSTGITAFTNPGDTATRFFRSKLSPLGAAIYDYGPGKQKDYQGNDLIIPIGDLVANRGMNKDAGALAWNTFATKILPLSIQDAINGYQTQGIGGAIGAGAVSAVGGGISSYEPTEKQKQVVSKSAAQDALDAAGLGPQIDKAYQSAIPQFSKELGIDASQYKSLKELRAAYVAALAPEIEKQQKLGPSAAKDEAGNSFDRAPSVKGWTSQRNAFTASFYKAHPDLAKQALQEGLISLAAYQKAIAK